jgi:energy-coupling factor transporter ATP-binding protein EcfA2
MKFNIYDMLRAAAEAVGLESIASTVSVEHADFSDADQKSLHTMIEALKNASHEKDPDPAHYAEIIWKSMPARVKKGSTLDQVEHYLREKFEEAKSGVSHSLSRTMDELNPFDDANSKPLVLRFGDKSFDSQGECPHQSRGVDEGGDPLEGLMNGEDIGEYRPVRVGPSRDDVIYLIHGVTVVVAPSGRGKTTFLRQMAQLLMKSDDYDVAFIPWNERESYSFLGSESDLVRAFEANIHSVDVVLQDSLRSWVMGGRSPGKGGVNTLFLMHLTQWHHAMADRGKALITVLNPVIDKQDHTDQVIEVLRGAAASILVLKGRGHAVYESVVSGRDPKDILIHEGDFVLGEKHQHDVPDAVAEGRTADISIPKADDQKLADALSTMQTAPYNF